MIVLLQPKHEFDDTPFVGFFGARNWLGFRLNDDAFSFAEGIPQAP